MKIKAKFKQIIENDPDTVFFLQIGKRKVPFIALSKPVQGQMICSDCGLGVWNASNLFNLVHFCPNTEMEIEFSDSYNVKVKLEKK